MRKRRNGKKKRKKRRRRERMKESKVGLNWVTHTLFSDLRSSKAP